MTRLRERRRRLAAADLAENVFFLDRNVRQRNVCRPRIVAAEIPAPGYSGLRGIDRKQHDTVFTVMFPASPRADDDLVRGLFMRDDGLRPVRHPGRSVTPGGRHYIRGDHPLDRAPAGTAQPRALRIRCHRTMSSLPGGCLSFMRSLGSAGRLSPMQGRTFSPKACCSRVKRRSVGHGGAERGAIRSGKWLGR